MSDNPAKRTTHTRRRRLILTVVIGVVLACLYVLRTGNGSTYYAQKWASQFKAWDKPETAKANCPRVASRTFPNGEWLYGVFEDSHSSKFFGGTIVIRDSKGRIRCFFGHVCGGHYLTLLSLSSEAKTLDDFYKLDLRRFKEWTPDLNR